MIMHMIMHMINFLNNAHICATYVYYADQTAGARRLNGSSVACYSMLCRPKLLVAIIAKNSSFLADGARGL
jgi:hypothetical protein